MEYDFPGNRYLSAFDSNGTFTFDDDLVFGYIRDSYGGIANVI
jgi:hypothetical protein